MYKAQLNNKELISVNNSENNSFTIDGNVFKVEKFNPENGHILIKNGHLSYSIKIHKVDYKNKSFELRLNGTKHSITIKDKFDLLLDEMGFDDKANSALNQLKAPMPGLILEVNVSEGEKVNTGDKLLVLEAMKMENVIKSPGEGIVKEIKVSKGDSVEKNQLLIQF